MLGVVNKSSGGSLHEQKGQTTARDQAPKRPRLHQVAIVGAGPAGLGCAVALKEFGVNDIVILDRHEVGASFRRWPQEMRLITPSFTANAFGLLDLNAIVAGTSPAYTLDREHPSGNRLCEVPRRRRQALSALRRLGRRCLLRRSRG